MKGRLALTVFSEEDFQRLYEIQKDVSLATMRQATGVADSIHDVENWMETRGKRQSPSDFCLAIRDLESSLLLGYVTLSSFDEEHATAEIGIVVHPGYQGGVGGPALKQLQRLAHEDFGFIKLVANVLLENSIGQRFFLKNGYIPISSTSGAILFGKMLDTI